MLKSINHIGIAVKNAEESLKTFLDIFQFSQYHREIVESQKVEVISFKVGDVLIELTAPTDESSTIAKFIEKRGEGIHHIAFETGSINNELERLSALGLNLINPVAVPGAHEMLISFLHPKSTNGVLMEICQKNHEFQEE
ncbi:MAG: methylmalonyl-CoA epimerase [Candidatus Kapabacteria bacterium]|nr:methylmalonyl-CoA epimerase [Candidatus Kapabacteria bacterium]